MKLSKLFPTFIILLSFFVSIYFYSRLPDLLATHWGSDGQVNGYSGKFFGLFFMPFLSIFLYFLFLFLPQTDPYKKNFNQFKNYFYAFINVVFIFLFYLHLLTILWNLDYRFNMIQVLSPAFAVIFYFAGVLTGHAKRNWFVGIRTPWTLHSDAIWDQTHQVGAKLFKITGILTLFCLFFPNQALFFLLVPVLLSTVFIFVYSYYLYRKTLTTD